MQLLPLLGEGVLRIICPESAEESEALRRTEPSVLPQSQVGSARCAAGNIDPEELLEVIELPWCSLMLQKDVGVGVGNRSLGIQHTQ